MHFFRNGEEKLEVELRKEFYFFEKKSFFYEVE
jgi:hypothetical protein